MLRCGDIGGGLSLTHDECWGVCCLVCCPAARASGRWEVSGEDEAALRAAFASFEQEDRRDRLGPPPPELFVKGPAISSSSSSQRRGREEQLEDDESMDGGDEEDGQED